MGNEKNWLHVMFGADPKRAYAGDGDEFLKTCGFADEEVKNAIALIMRRCRCAVMFGDGMRGIRASMGGRVNRIDAKITSVPQIALFISKPTH